MTRGPGPTYATVARRLWAHLEREGRAKSTRDGYRKCWARMAPFWGTRYVPQPQRVIDQYVRENLDGRSAGTVRQHLAVLSAVHGLHCRETGAVPPRIARPTVRQRTDLPCVSEPDLAAILDAARGPRRRTALLLMADAGLRRSELLLLTGPDVRLDADPPHLRLEVRETGPKSGRQRIVPVFTLRLASALDGFAGIGLKHPDSVTALIWQAFAHGVIQSPACHALRRRFGRRLYEVAGLDLDVIRALYGHVSTQTTWRYLGLDAEGARTLSLFAAGLPNAGAKVPSRVGEPCWTRTSDRRIKSSRDESLFDRARRALEPDL